MFLWCICIPIKDICEHVNLDATSQYNGVFSIQFCSNHTLASSLNVHAKRGHPQKRARQVDFLPERSSAVTAAVKPSDKDVKKSSGTSSTAHSSSHRWRLESPLLKMKRKVPLPVPGTHMEDILDSPGVQVRIRRFQADISLDALSVLARWVQRQYPVRAQTKGIHDLPRVLV